MGFVYVADFGDKVKVGFSDNVERRIRQLETGSGNLVVQRFSQQGTKQKEQAVHQKLKGYKIVGEYYSVKFEDAVTIVKNTADPPIQDTAQTNIAFKVKTILALHGMTQKELAERTGVRPPTVSAICTGTAKHIPVNVLDAFCRELHCQPGDLIEYVEEGDGHAQ